MRRNPVGDFVLGTLGGGLTAYFGVGAVLVLLSGQALPLGPAMPLVAEEGSAALMQLMVRMLQAIYFGGLAMTSFVTYRVLQEVLRGHPVRAALREAATGPRLW